MADAYAVITPAGELSWYPLDRAADVEAIVGGPVAPGALATVTVANTRIPGRGPLKVLASDIGALFTADYPINPVAGLVLIAPCRRAALIRRGTAASPWSSTRLIRLPVRFCGRGRCPPGGSTL